MIDGPRKSPNPRPERALLAALSALILGLAALDFFSPVSQAVRRGSPLSLLLSLRAANNSATQISGEDLSPAQYLLIYTPGRRTVDFLYIPETSVLEGLAGKINWVLAWTVPAGFGSLQHPEKAREWIFSRGQDAGFWLEIPRFISELRKAVKPAPSLYDAWRLALEIFRLPKRSVRLRWLSGSDESRRLLERLLASGAAPPLPAAPITVEILNASSQAGVALEATKVLRLRGVDVVDFGNAASPSARTYFLDRTGSFETAAAAAKALGCATTEVMTRLDSGRPAAVTLILGQDFRECSAMAERQ